MDRILLLVKYDLKFLSGQLHFLRFVVFTVPIVIFMWSYAVKFHHLLYIFVLGFLTLEGVYTNAFFRLPNELERMSLFPISWRKIIVAKGVSTVLFTLPFVVLCAVVVSYASVIPPPSDSLWEGILFMLSATFPMLTFGGFLSLDYPTRRVSLNFDEAPYLVFQLIALGVSSLPFLVLKVGFGSDTACLLFSVLAAITWYFGIVPHLAVILEEREDRVLAQSSTPTTLL